MIPNKPKPIKVSNDSRQSNGMARNTQSPSSSTRAGNQSPLRSSLRDRLETEEWSYHLKMKIAELEKDLTTRQENFIARERAYKTRIDELEEEFHRTKARKSGWMRHDPIVMNLKDMQVEIKSHVDLLEDRTHSIQRIQEGELIKAFRGRLSMIQSEMDKQKSKVDDGSIAAIENSHALESQVESLKETCDKLERLNQVLHSENNELKTSIAKFDSERLRLSSELSQETERNGQLKDQLHALHKERSFLQDHVNMIL
jgi:chromosome segregation ATPase